ncbi:hypothetical protein EXIGLDRAFT_141286 [Exidia glandulosa HHB12029]|uniref:Uncharacterized protein n=1 Tax=Exidia glandulosa HHB12029 TaxID=1314781 RepID=A0A165FUZ9_EXIGL|nr:hypothetical protein EXIGLDRAFT_141286 [Exidia glandulosa HHB12029]
MRASRMPGTSWWSSASRSRRASGLATALYTLRQATVLDTSLAAKPTSSHVSTPARGHLLAVVRVRLYRYSLPTPFVGVVKKVATRVSRLKRAPASAQRFVARSDYRVAVRSLGLPQPYPSARTALVRRILGRGRHNELRQRSL